MKIFFSKHLNQKKKAEIYKKLYGNSIFKNFKTLKKKHVNFLKSLKTRLKFSFNNKKFFLHMHRLEHKFLFLPECKKKWFNKLGIINLIILYFNTHIPMKKT